MEKLMIKKSPKKAGRKTKKPNSRTERPAEYKDREELLERLKSLGYW